MSSGTDSKTQLSRGFTVIEMMITLLVLAVLIVVGAPAFTDLIKDNRMLSDVYAMRAALNNARSEAMARRAVVTLCRSDSGTDCDDAADWKDGFIAFTDADDNGAVDDPNDPDGDDVFSVKLLDSDYLAVMKYSHGNASDASDNRVRFDSQGYARGFSGTFTFCDDRGATHAKGLTVAAGGIVQAADLDPNDPSICN